MMYENTFLFVVREMIEKHMYFLQLLR